MHGTSIMLGKEYLRPVRLRMIMRMNYRKGVCLLLGACLLLAGGCSHDRNTGDETFYDSGAAPQATEIVYEEVKTNIGQAATYGDMTMTVNSVDDPGITMERTGKKALFFNVTIQNGSSETVGAGYLNNFDLTVDGTYFQSDQCCTIPVMKELYDFYGTEALSLELAPGESVTGYVACEVDPGFKEMEFHYIPKTTDRGSHITVPITSGDLTSVTKP